MSHLLRALAACAGVALLPACSEEGDTIVVQTGLPAVKEVFVGCDEGLIVRLPSDGKPVLFYQFPPAPSSAPTITGLAWDDPSRTLFSVRRLAPSAHIYRHALDGTTTRFADKDDTGNDLFAVMIAVSPSGQLHATVRGNGNDRIVKFDARGKASRVHDTGETETIWGLAFAPSGDLFYSLERNEIRKVIDENRLGAAISR